MARKMARSTKGKNKKARPARRKVGKAKAKKTAKSKQRQVERGKAGPGTLVAYEQRGLGARSAGQSGDTQGLSAAPNVDSESVEELMEEGQSFEAEVLNGIERVPDPDEEEVRTREVPEDDVPEEYREKD